MAKAGVRRIAHSFEFANYRIVVVAMSVAPIVREISQWTSSRMSQPWNSLHSLVHRLSEGRSTDHPSCWIFSPQYVDKMQRRNIIVHWSLPRKTLGFDRSSISMWKYPAGTWAIEIGHPFSEDFLVEELAFWFQEPIYFKLANHSPKNYVWCPKTWS